MEEKKICVLKIDRLLTPADQPLVYLYQRYQTYDLIIQVEQGNIDVIVNNMDLLSSEGWEEFLSVKVAPNSDPVYSFYEFDVEMSEEEFLIKLGEKFDVTGINLTLAEATPLD